MRFLENLYPGDAVIGVLAVAIMAVAVTSAIAWTVSLLFGRSPAVRHCVLLSGLIAALTSPLLAMAFHASGRTLVHLPLLGAERQHSMITPRGIDHDERPVVAPPTNPFESAVQIEAESAQAVAAPAVSQSSSNSPEITVGELAAAPIDVFHSTIGASLGVWLGGTLACLIGLVIGGWRLRQLRRSLQPISDADLGGVIDAARCLLGRKLAVEVMASPKVRTPLAAGWLRPIVILPVDLPSAISREQLCDVLLHEMAHVARRDNFVVMLQALAKALYWPIPFVHLLNRQLAQTREEVCDNHVLSRRDAVSYGETLLRLAQLAHGATLPFGSVGILHWRGKLEQRVVGLFQSGRSTLTRAPRSFSLTVGAAFLTASVALASVTIFAAPAAESDPTAVANEKIVDDENAKQLPATESEKSDPSDPKFAGHFAGQVVGPDGQPLAHARIFMIPIFANTRDAGSQRAESDANGRFEFDAPDMTYSENDGLAARRQGLLVATAPGLAADWIHTWGQSNDTGLRSHWDPIKGAELKLQLAKDDAPIHGRFLDADGHPLANAQVRLTRIMVPSSRDLDAHLESESHRSIFASPPGYERELIRLNLIPGLKTETHTDADGRFTFTGIGRDRLAELSVTAPSVVDTTLTVMTRDVPDFRIQPSDAIGNKLGWVIHGAGFTMKLERGRTTKGRVIDLETRQPIAGIWVGTRSEMPLNSIATGEFARITDADGRFTITGERPLMPDNDSSDIVTVSAPGMPYQTVTTKVEGDVEVLVECPRGIPYHLKLVDEQGKPVEADVTYVDIQPNPHVEDPRFSLIGRKSQRFFDPRWQIGRAGRNADGSYSGFVLPGPGAVLVKTKRSANYRPAHVDPKKFFAPEKTIWTDQEQVTEFGTHDTLSTNGYWWLNQHDYSEIVLVNPVVGSKPLELSATLVRDRPRRVSLIDDQGQGVVGAQTDGLTFHPYDTELPLRSATFPLNGLHPDRVQRIEFLKKDQQLIGSLEARGDGDTPYVVHMRPWGTITGRIVDEQGKPLAASLVMGNYGLVIDQNSEIALHPSAKTDAEGRFRVGEFVPGLKYSGRIFVGETWSGSFAGTAFEKLVLAPGETRDLGDIRIRQSDAKTGEKAAKP